LFGLPIHSAKIKFETVERWIFEENTSGAYYNATGLIANTIYEIETHTVDKAGNINTT